MTNAKTSFLRFGFLKAGFFAAVVALAPIIGWAQSRGVVNVYNWSDYIDEDTLRDFERQTGIKVNYDVYDSNDILETKLLAGRTGFDVVVPTNTYLARLIQAKVLRPLDKAKLPNLRHMDPELMRRLEKYDPGNQHAVIYMWGTSGIGINVDKVRAAMPNAPIDSLRMLFDPAVVSRLASCGVTMLDAPDEIIPAALKYLGLNPDSKDPEVLAKAEEVLMKVRPFIRKFHSSQYINDLANGDVCVAFGWSGDILQAQTRAEEAKNRVRIEYYIPREGALQWFDNFAVPVDAPNFDNAMAFINYMMDPRVVAKNSNYISYPNGNAASVKYIDKSVTENPNIFPPKRVVDRLYTISPNTQAQQRIFTRIWTRVKGAS